jgi:hypothetical protein
MVKLFNWSKNNIYLLFTVFLMVFIPLYPKLPTLDIFGTWVYIRLEDFAVALAIIYLIGDSVRKKTIPKTTLTVPILVYWIVGGISLVWSILFIGPHLSGYFPHLAILHYARRFEYMFLFFIAFNAAKKTGNLRFFIGATVFTTICITLYGLGQKFLGFPAYLTMNEEFAKGIPLRLPPTARIPSTFGGHYDLGAYLVLVIPIFASLMVGVKKIWLKVFFLLLSLSSLGLLLLTASRISFGVYLLATCAIYLWHKKPLLIIPTVIVSFVMLNLVAGASERFYKTFRFSDVIVDLSTGKPIGTLDKLEGGKALLDKQENPAEENLPQGSEFINVPQSNTPATSVKTVELFKSSELSSGSGEIATISGSFLIQKALVYDISITTRFQGQWPKAIEAFKRNILLGSGYSTLSVAADGDYLRMLGETGILGTIAFLGIFYAVFVLFKRQKKLDNLTNSYVIGILGGLVGLSLNAVLIDVFEASKVAFTLWLLLGICVALLDGVNKNPVNYGRLIFETLFNRVSFIIYLFIIVCLVYGGILSGYFVGDDFTWLKWAATSTLTNIGGYFTDAQGFFYRPVPKLWYFLLYSLFWLKSGSYQFVTLILYLMLVFNVYLALKLRKISDYIVWPLTLLFGVMSIHHENVYWISGYSSLLSALFFLMALNAYQYLWQKDGKNFGLQAGGLVLIILGMLSYEGLILAPLIIWLASIFIGRKKFSEYLWILVLIPVYWWVRVQSGAVISEGDYAYNFQKLPLNYAVNTAGYLVSVLAGPKGIEFFESLRLNFKSQIRTVSLATAFLGILIVYIGTRFKRVFYQIRESLFWLLTAFFSIMPYLGLGGIAERYALLFSALVVLSFGVLLQPVFAKPKYPGSKFLIMISVVGLIFWNIKEVKAVNRDWQKAYTVSKQTLLTVRKEFFPLKTSTAFAIVNTPTRYGRAWIFPTGLNDAFWHLFRSSPYTVFPDKTLNEAFQHPGFGSLYVLTFEDFTLKRVQREIQVIE